MTNATDTIDNSALIAMADQGGDWFTYQNVALDSADLGGLRFLNCGDGCTIQKPPLRYPDTHLGVGWRYQLAGKVDIARGLTIDLKEARKRLTSILERMQSEGCAVDFRRLFEREEYRHADAVSKLQMLCRYIKICGIGAVWAKGMATGIILISLTPGYTSDLMSYLFGNILMIGVQDLWLIGGLAVFVLIVVSLFHKQLLAVCFDAEFATLRGVRVQPFYFLLLGLTALTVVLLVSVVGIILVIALLTLPAAMANLFARRLWHMMALAALFCAVLTTGGLVLSYDPDLPAGAVTILLTGISYFLVVGLRRKN